MACRRQSSSTLESSTRIEACCETATCATNLGGLLLITDSLLVIVYKRVHLLGELVLCLDCLVVRLVRLGLVLRGSA